MHSERTVALLYLSQEFLPFVYKEYPSARGVGVMSYMALVFYLDEGVIPGLRDLVRRGFTSVVKYQIGLQR